MVQVCCSRSTISSRQGTATASLVILLVVLFQSVLNATASGTPLKLTQIISSSGLRVKPKSTQQPTKPYMIWPPPLPHPHRLPLPSCHASCLQLLQHANTVPLEFSLIPAISSEMWTLFPASLLYFSRLLPPQSDTVSSPFLSFAVVMCHEVRVHCELANTEPFAPGGNTGLGCCKPLVTIFLSTNQYVTLFSVFLFKGLPE